MELRKQIDALFVAGRIDSLEHKAMVEAMDEEKKVNTPAVKKWAQKAISSGKLPAEMIHEYHNMAATSDQISKAPLVDDDGDEDEDEESSSECTFVPDAVLRSLTQQVISRESDPGIFGGIFS